MSETLKTVAAKTLAAKTLTSKTVAEQAEAAKTVAVKTVTTKTLATKTVTTKTVATKTVTGCHNYQLRPAKRPDGLPINELIAKVFGPGRLARTASRIRERADVSSQFTLTAWSGDRLVGLVTFTPLQIAGRSRASLLGPLAILPECKGKGLGVALMKAGMEALRAKGFDLIVLVGDLPYYARAGFQVVPWGQISLPGPVDPDRLLACELEDGALYTYRGLAMPSASAA